MTEGEERALVRNAQSAVDGVLVLSSARLLMVTINIFMLYSSCWIHFWLICGRRSRRRTRPRRGKKGESAKI